MEPRIDLSILDWIVLGVYLAAMIGIGLVAGRRVKTTDQYFLGHRKFNRWIMMGQSLGTGTHAEMPVSLAGAVYTSGVSAIWFQWKNLFATPFYWVFAPIIRRFRRTTVAEVLDDRYGPWMGAFYTVFALAFFTINSASMLKGAGKVISQATGGHVPVDMIVVAMTLVFIFYSFIGGLLAAAWADFVQGFLILTLSFMLIPLGWGLVGGMDGMQATLGPDKFTLATPKGIGVWFIFMLTVNGLIGIMAQPHMVGMVGTGRDEHACRMGFLGGTFVKRFCTVGWALVGLMAAAMVARNTFGVSALHDPEDAFGFVCRHLLFPGGVGLLIASVLAANMAACSAFMVDSGALFTRNFYRKYLVKDKPDRHYLWIGRVSGLVITIFGVLYAIYLIQRVLYSFLLTETMATYMGISLMGGIVWERANRWGALASFCAAAITNFALYSARGQRLDAWDPNVFVWALLAGIATLIVVSLLTPPEPAGKLNSFYARLQTPIELAPGENDAPATPPDRSVVAKRGQQLLIVNLLHLAKGAGGRGFFQAYREDLRGFAAGWAVAIALVFMAWLLFK